MQELEKILEEIKAHRNFASECGNFNVASAFELCVEIIRKHMNDGWIPENKQPETCKYTGGSCCWPIDQCKECPNYPERSEEE